MSPFCLVFMSPGHMRRFVCLFFVCDMLFINFSACFFCRTSSISFKSHGADSF